MRCRYIATVTTPLVCELPALRPAPTTTVRIVCVPLPAEPQPDAAADEHIEQAPWLPRAVAGSGRVADEAVAALRYGRTLPRPAKSAAAQAAAGRVVHERLADERRSPLRWNGAERLVDGAEAADDDGAGEEEREDTGDEGPVAEARQAIQAGDLARLRALLEHTDPAVRPARLEARHSSACVWPPHG
jgi:hypothetical protein